MDALSVHGTSVKVYMRGNVRLECESDLIMRVFIYSYHAI